ncbi:hypothetical protein M6B38_299500 [Iris pallida]|uniref:Uncharacterized protein n=1 Tax=Iris pallida TaxID=29817 RepID=A0AAX6HQL5_IRIPA|nr:hypothetical protein M6B38_299500 [Iris pallida]
MVLWIRQRGSCRFRRLTAVARGLCGGGEKALASGVTVADPGEIWRLMVAHEL